jgi:UDP-N-acetylmuramyl pentapeptide phosphotransferase/UDP-N-acetylglucosamine-1-phosphate transferase
MVLSFLLTGLATWYASRIGLLDQPGERHSHTVATPRGGGAGMMLALLISSLILARDTIPAYWLTCIAPGMTTLALLGWWDDHRPLSARFRFLVQLAVTIHLLWCASSAAWLDGSMVMVVLAALFVLWMTNLYNFMDGSNGMAGMQGVFSAGVMAWLFSRAGDGGSALLASLIAACCIGFLPWNLGRARVFMGDVGSLPMGFVLAALILHGVDVEAFSTPVALLLMLVFLTDSTLTLLMRVMKGERWYNAHRQHLYQRLIGHGWTHGSVVLLYQTINMLLVLPGIVVAVNYPVLAWPISLVMAMIFGLTWCMCIRKFGVLARAG